MNQEEFIYIAIFLTGIALFFYGLWWIGSRIYYYIKFGSLDPIFREKD